MNLTDELRAAISEFGELDEEVTIDNIKVAWDSDSAQAEVTFEYLARGGGYQSGYSNAITDKSIPFDTSESVAGLDDNWFSRFIKLQSHWSQLGTLPIGYAREITKSALGQELSSAMEKQSIVGVTIRGEHIGVLGPTIIFVLAVYLFMYTRQARTSLYSIGPGEYWAPNWVAIMEPGMAGFVSFLTLVIVPNLAIVLALYRFVYAHISVLIPTFVLLPVSYLTHLFARDMAIQLAADKTFSGSTGSQEDMTSEKGDQA